jgi:hypothetical protein
MLIGENLHHDLFSLVLPELGTLLLQLLVGLVPVRLTLGGRDPQLLEQLAVFEQAMDRVYRRRKARKRHRPREVVSLGFIAFPLSQE